MRPSLAGLFALIAGAVLTSVSAQTPTPPTHSWLAPLRDDAARLIRAATGDDFAWQRLAELTDTYGNRLSGSENLGRAVEWAARTMKADGLENVLRVVDREIPTGRESVLEIDYELGADQVEFREGGVGFLTDMTDLGGTFFEKWGPTSFEDDAFAARGF
jgi:hypothetical protein